MNRLNANSFRVGFDDLSRGLIYLFFIISIAEPYLNELMGSVTKYYMFFVMFIVLQRDGYNLQLRRISIAYIAWLCVKVLSLLWSEDFTVPKMHAISQVGMVLFMVILLSSRSKGDMIRHILDVYWIASIVLGVLSIFLTKTYLDIDEARQVLHIMGVEIDPNNQAALLLIGAAISAANILYEKRRIIASSIGLLISVYACFMTSSRGAFVTLLVMAVFCIVYSGAEKRKFKDALSRIAVMLLILGAVYYITVQYLPEASLDRLFDFSKYGDGSDRGALWGIIWDKVTEDPLAMLIGTGWGSAYKYLDGKAVHNTFLTFLSDTGIVGLLLFVIPILIATVRLMKQKRLTPVLLLIAQMVPAFFIDAINKRFFWNAIIILFVSYYSIPTPKCDCDELSERQKPITVRPLNQNGF